MGRFFLEKIVQGVAYEKLKFKNGIDMEVQVNLIFVYFDGHDLGNPTTLEDESCGSFEEFIGRD
jgi:hypothetical protein